MNAPRQFRTPLKRAKGLGSAKSGTGHFLWQRITAIALLLAGVYLLGLLVGLSGVDYATARAVVANPVNATVLIAFLIAMFWHAKLGIQVVIEDYVHNRAAELALLLLNILLCSLGALASLYAIARIALLA